MNKKILTTLLAGALTASMVIPAFATGATNNTTTGGAIPSSEGTDVFAGVMLNDIDAKVKVEVPTLFAFVVNGSVSDTDAVAITNEHLSLPNVKVVVDIPSDGATDAVYHTEVEETGSMRFTNYSTKAGDVSGDPREGLAVSINGTIIDEGSLESRNYWQHVASVTDDEDDVKKYVISIDGKDFNQAKDGGFTMATGIDLDKPELGFNTSTNKYSNLDDDGKYAISGITKDVTFGVKVGGLRNQYNKVEQSAKVGTIVWTIATEQVNAVIETVPSGTAVGAPTP
jgi:hypothetical protein